MLKYRGETLLSTTRGGLKYHQWYTYHRLGTTGIENSGNLQRRLQRIVTSGAMGELAFLEWGLVDFGKKQ